MLHTVIFISSAGLVLFIKEFVNSSIKPSQLGGIMTAMLKVSQSKVGVPVSYIQMENASVSLSVSSSVTCGVFHDTSDGSEFGKLMSHELLYNFCTFYHSEIKESQFNSPDTFNDFNGRIATVIRNSAKPVVEALNENKGITMAMLNTHDTITHSTMDVDKLQVLANHAAIINASNDIMGAKNDSTGEIIIKSKKFTTFLQRIERNTLVVMVKNNVETEGVKKEIDKAAALLRQILVMASNLKT